MYRVYVPGTTDWDRTFNDLEKAYRYQLTLKALGQRALIESDPYGMHAS